MLAALLTGLPQPEREQMLAAIGRAREAQLHRKRNPQRRRRRNPETGLLESRPDETDT